MGLNQVIVDYFKRNNIKMVDVARVTKFPQSTLSSITRRPEANPSHRTLQSLINYYPDILEGYEQAGDLATITTIKQSSNDTWQGVPMYDVPVSAGNIALFRDDSTFAPSFHLNAPQFRDCTFGLKVSGDSMYPKIENGDYVICKEMQTIIYGEVYLIVTYDGIETVKLLYPNEVDADMINLVPYNKDFPITPIPRKDIVKLFKVKAVFKSL